MEIIETIVLAIVCFLAGFIGVLIGINTGRKK